MHVRVPPADVKESLQILLFPKISFLETSNLTNLDESILKTNIYVDGILAVVGNVKLDTTNYGVAGYLIMFVIAISFILMFSGSKTGVLISMVLTLAGSIGLGLVSGNLIGIGASGLWLLIIIVVGIYKINSGRRS